MPFPSRSRCGDDFATALHVFEHALKLAKPSKAGMLRHMELLGQVARLDAPLEVRTALRNRRAQLAQQLISQGLGRLQQFPRRFVPFLPSQPWWEGCDEACGLLRGFKERLLEEYRELRRAGSMQRELECLHSHQGGHWSRFEISERERCLQAPKACELLEGLRKLGVPVIRGGYSALEAKSWLKPHFGATNAQLKWHLGPLDGVLSSSKGRSREHGV